MIAAAVFAPSRLAAGFSTRTTSVFTDAPLARFRGRVFGLTQVHSTRIVEVGERDEPSGTRDVEADGLVTRVPGRLLTVWTADCVPVLLSARDGSVVAALHAGWRGLVAGIIPAGVELLRGRHGVHAGAIDAAVGPSIGACCYEVGDDVAALIAASCGPASVIARPGKKPHADVRAAAVGRLVAAGVDRERIEVIDRCTRCEGAEFYSRRGGAAGKDERQCGFIGILGGG